jgi:4-hydroxy-3-methylbut-2-enyl diphosphate reductase IspH
MQSSQLMKKTSQLTQTTLKKEKVRGIVTQMKKTREEIIQ